jgi:hypothetical protein
MIQIRTRREASTAKYSIMMATLVLREKLRWQVAVGDAWKECGVDCQEADRAANS